MPAQGDLSQWPQPGKYSNLKVIAPHRMKCGVQVCKYEIHLVAFQWGRVWSLVFAPKNIYRYVVLNFSGTPGITKHPANRRHDVVERFASADRQLGDEQRKLFKADACDRRAPISGQKVPIQRPLVLGQSCIGDGRSHQREPVLMKKRVLTLLPDLAISGLIMVRDI